VHGEYGLDEDGFAQANLLGSLMTFQRTFFELQMGAPFALSSPIGRECRHLTMCRALKRVFRGDCKRLMINIPPRYGKAIDIASEILTKEGWKLAGDIQIGDFIVGSKGYTEVLGVYPQGICEAKRVTFSDNQLVICNDSHLWTVKDRYTDTWKVKTTKEISETLFEADERKHWHIPMVDGEFGSVEPFIDPYHFGCWLGDGNSANAGITTMDLEIVKSFEDAGHIMTKRSSLNTG
jgi:hypothetical protein